MVNRYELDSAYLLLIRAPHGPNRPRGLHPARKPARRAAVVLHVVAPRLDQRVYPPLRLRFRVRRQEVGALPALNAEAALVEVLGSGPADVREKVRELKKG